MALSRDTLRAIDAYDEKVDAFARERYGISGAALLAKLVKGESGDRMGAVSSANARGIAQFIPSTRQAVIRKTKGKVDPWRSRREAIAGAVMHLTGELGNAKGLEGYNPGMSTYPSYILNQKVGDVGKQIRRAGGSTGGGGGGSTGGSSGTPARTETTVTGAGFNPGDVSALAALAQQTQPKPQAPIGAPQGPQFSAQAVMPQGYQAPSAQPIPQQQGSSLTDLLSQIGQSGQSIPQVDVKTRTVEGSGGRQSGSGGGGGSRKGLKGDFGGPLLELFYNGPGGVNVDNGKRVKRGFVSGHTDHVHVAAGPKTVRTLAKLAEDMGLTVRELAPYDKVDPVHTNGSYHYRNQAADISGDPRKMAEYSRRVARLFGVKA